MKNNNTVTVVLTSCGRLDLLKKTLASFFECNTYPLEDFILIEDSAKASLKDVKNCIPAEFRNSVSIIINKTRLGQVHSIDKAYKNVKTKYVFHCEDDWLFYRSGFIEESIKILATDEKIFSVWLRSYYHDLFEYSKNNILLGDKLSLDCFVYRRVYSKSELNNECFSLNPSLREHKHYPKNGYASLLDKDEDLEIAASSLYESQGMYSVLLENDVIEHLGFGRHIKSNKHKQKRKRNKLIGLFIIFAVFFIGFFIGAIKN